MDTIDFNASFKGGSARNHLVPAYDSISALYGISRGILVPTHFLTDDAVRHRNISSPNYNLFLSPPREGSVEFLFQLAVNLGPVLANHPIVTGVTTKVVSEFITNSMKRTVGKDDQIKKNILEERIDEGTKEAIAASMEPSIRSGHKIINNGVLNITVNAGDNSVVFDGSTKNYINNFNVSDSLSTRLLSVGSYNVNTKSGGAFDSEAGRVIPFTLASNTDGQSIISILDSQRAYAQYRMSENPEERDRAFIAMQHYEIRDGNNKLKRLEIVKARPNIDDI